MLREIFAFAQKEFTPNEIHAIAHSQGTFITAESKLPFSSVVQVAFPLTIPYERLLKKFATRSGAILNLEGDSYVPQTEGSTSIIPRECWEEYKRFSPFASFVGMPSLESVLYVAAQNDEKLVGIEYSELRNHEGIRFTEIAGDHNFTGKYRESILSLLKKLFL